MGFFNKLFGKQEKVSLNKGLEKTKDGLFSRLSRIITGKTKIDEEILEELEAALLGADVGLATTDKIMEAVREKVSREHFSDTAELNLLLQRQIELLLIDHAEDEFLDFGIPEKVRPYVILVVGVNGVGKTTTIGKLAYNYKKAGHSVLLGAADTFRAAAIEQLEIWSKRVDVPIVKQLMGSDPGAVAFDTVQSAVKRGSDVVIIDTAGRLHNKAGLMDELSKIRRVISKVIPDAPHEVMLVLDGSTGQNALVQAREFSAVTPVNSLCITKLDGTAKGGIVLSIADQLKIPVKFIGVGEQMEDLLVFSKHEFVDSLFSLTK